MTLDLSELINLPGSGNAEAAIKKAGYWDATKIIDGETEYSFTVEVKGTYYPTIERQEFTVIAKTEDEGLDLAEDMSDFDEIDDTTVIDVTEAT